jgi:hypothetical protein
MIAIFPEIAAAAAGSDVERLAVLVRKYFAGTQAQSPKVDPRSLLIGAGVEVQRLPLGGKTLAALLAKDERGAFNIVAVLNTSGATKNIMATDTPAERFLLAHMLGHVLFDIQPQVARGELQVTGYRESFCPLKRYGQGGIDAETQEAAAQRKEERADDFAAAVLLPLAMTRKAIVSFKGDMEKTAQFFNVTRACLTRRLTQIGYLGAGSPSFLDAEQSLAKAAMAGAKAPATARDMLGRTDLDEAQMEMLKAANPALGTVPKAFAAASYGQDQSPKIIKGAAGSGGDAKAVASGMERIRELAKRLDKSER